MDEEAIHDLHAEAPTRVGCLLTLAQFVIDKRKEKWEFVFEEVLAEGWIHVS
jgi:hypothetical protein